jgi:beta-mannosidase
MELAGPWVAAAADEDLRRAFAEDGFDDRRWEPIAVPGHWRSTPAFAGSDGPLLYRTRFAHRDPAPAGARRTWLVFDGLFSQGDVWLDGTYLGDTEGWFAPHAMEVTSLVRERDEHVLAVEVANPRRAALTGVFAADDRLDRSWNAGGLWRPVRLEATGPVRIVRLSVVCREATAARAVLALRAELDTVEARTVAIRTTVGGTDHELDQPLAAGANRVAWTVAVDSPALWWPRVLGDRPLHEAAVEVVADGQVSDRRERRVGLRAVTMRDSVVRVNGERLFCKGADLLPTRQAMAEAGGADVAGDVALAVDAGLDLLRVHAHVARPELYDAADEAGLLLWQDLPLQGPAPRGLRRHAVALARDAVDLLGHHPSIAMWCAHDRPTPGSRVWLDRSIRRALAKADGSRPVLGSPHLLSYGWRTGDAGGLARLAAAVPRLVRFPVAGGAVAAPGGHGPWAAVEDEDVVRRRFGSPAAADQAHQAEVVRLTVDALRRLKYRPTGGFVVPTLADAVPAVTSAVLDAGRRPKAAHAALVAACRPVVVVTDPLPATVLPGEPLAVDVHVVSDLRVPVEDATVTATLRWDGGAHRWAWRGRVPADGCVRVGVVRAVAPDRAGCLDLTAELHAPGHRSTTRHAAEVAVAPGALGTR